MYIDFHVERNVSQLHTRRRGTNGTMPSADTTRTIHRLPVLS